MNPSQLFAQIKAFLARYSLQQKLGMVFAAGMVVVLMWAMVYFVNRVEYQVLYSELDPNEAQGIVTKLQAMLVPYKVSDDGTTIRIASDKLPEVRIQLASEGLPESGRVGFEIFERNNFGLTNFQEQVNFQRALEGELARSIMTLNEVSAARVHLVMARESLYQNRDDQSKASVILKLRNGRSLAGSAVQGIVNVVASSVRGLSPEKITVIDYRGKVLSQPQNEGSLTGQQLDVRQKMESEMAAKITQILEPTVGAGKVRPQVSIAMNFQQVEETTEQYDPEKSVIKSTQRQVDSGALTAPVGGIVGPKVSATSANPPAAGTPGAPPAAAPAPTTPAQPLKQNEVINYEVSKSIRHVLEPVGRIDRISVAVIVDNHTTTTTNAEGKVEPKSNPRTPEDMKKYKDLVSAAIAFNAERGDQLIVENVSFEGEAESIPEPTFFEKQAPTIMIGAKYIALPIGFILIYMLFIRPVQKTVFATWQPAEAGLGRSLPLPRAAGGVQTPMTVRQLEAQLQNPGAAHEAIERELLAPSQPSRVDMIRERIVEHAKQDPETVARLVRVWLNEEKNK